jgi:glutathione reductase (NADPH)
MPDIDDLDLDRAGIEREKRGVRVNEYLQSVSNPAVYAAGDAAASGPMLTPVASFEGKMVAANLLHGNSRKIEYPPVPTVVFTLPPLASVGLQEQDAQARGMQFKKTYARTGDWYSSRRMGEEFSAHKVLIDEVNGHILGAHLLGPNADELINLFTLAIRAGMTADEIKKTIFAYPTRASDVAHML